MEKYISKLFNCDSDIAKCLKYNDPSNYADNWNLEIYPAPEDQLKTAKQNMIAIATKNSSDGKGHN